jgi:hypothetical protein
VRAKLSWIVILGTGLAAATEASAQALPPGAEDTLSHAVGSRIESITILSGTAGSAAGLFRWRVHDANLEISKVFGLGDVGEGDSGISWNAVVGGALGHYVGINQFNDTVLEGNESRTSGWAMSLEGGARVNFPADLSSRLTLGVIYGRTKNQFDAQTPTGQQVEQVAGGGFVNWVVDSITLAPSFELSWRPRIGDFSFIPSSRVVYYRTEQLHSNSDALEVGGDSTTWTNRLDADYKTPWDIGGYSLHLGGHFSRVNLYGNVQDGLQSNYFYEAGPRIVAEVWDDLWIIQFLGLSATYFWSNSFSGWTWAIEMNLKF